MQDTQPNPRAPVQNAGVRPTICVPAAAAAAANGRERLGILPRLTLEAAGLIDGSTVCRKRRGERHALRWVTPLDRHMGYCRVPWTGLREPKLRQHAGAGGAERAAPRRQ